MITIHNIEFNVVINKKRIHNIYLRVDGNCINASCPNYVSDYEVYRFIENKRDWVYKTYLYNQQSSKNRVLYHGGNNIFIFGEEYKLVFIVGRKKFNIYDKKVYFSYKDDSDNRTKALYKELDDILLKYAEKYIDKYRNILLDYGYNDFPKIKARIMNSKWGVCYTKNNSITISSFLIHYPHKCLEYIVLHELVHFIIPNHSKRFYEIVSNNMPNYKEINELLK